MVNERFTAYQGNLPYAFVSYAHADSSRVYPLITGLYNEGFRIWYDEGIAPTTRYLGEINEHIEKCSVFILFISETSIIRPDVIKEFAYAESMKKTILLVHLDNVSRDAADPVLRGEMSTNQGILWYGLPDSERQRKLREKLAQCAGDAPEITICVQEEKKQEHKKSELLQKAAAHMSLGENAKAFDVYSDVAARYPEEYMGHWGMVLSETRNFTDYTIGDASFEYIKQHCIKAIMHAPESEKEELSSAWNRYAEKVEKHRADEIENEKLAAAGKNRKRIIAEIGYAVIALASFIGIGVFTDGDSPLEIIWIVVFVAAACIMRYIFKSRFLANMPKVICLVAALTFFINAILRFFGERETETHMVEFILMWAFIVGVSIAVITAGVLISRRLKKGLPEK